MNHQKERNTSFTIVKDFNGVDFYLLKPHPFFSFPWPETVSSKFYLEFYVYLCSHWCARSLKNWGYFLWSFNLDSFSFPLAVLCFQFNRGTKFEEFDTQDLRFQEPKMYSWCIIWWFVTFLFLFFFSNSLFLFFFVNSNSSYNLFPFFLKIRPWVLFFGN